MRFFILFRVVALLFLVVSCAKISSPTGGEKDTIPPILIKASPLNETKNFKAKRIKFKFDEYVKLKNIYKSLVVSPPLKYRLSIKPLGTAAKKFSFRIKDTLRKNSTYVFSFGNSIVDNNENNPLKDFRYVFSTGEVIDSLKISGTVKYAQSKKMAKNMTLALYHADTTYTDSIVYKQKPVYIANTLDTMAFTMTHLKEGDYHLISLEDKNGDYQYQPRKEQIGFLKKPIHIPSDSTYEMTVFKEIPPLKVTRPTEQSKGKIFITYKGLWKDTKISIAKPTPQKFKHLFTHSKAKKTWTLWHNAQKKDSIFVHIKGVKVDSIYLVKLRLTKQDTLLKTKAMVSGTLHPRDTFAIQTNHPLMVIDTSKIHFFDKDTVLVPFDYQLTPQQKEVKFVFKKQPKNKYYIQMMPKSFVDFFGFANDTITNELNTKDLEDYAILNVQFKNIVTYGTVWATLTKNNGKDIVARKKLNATNEVIFKNLVPQTYYIQLLIDDNKNGVWDTGDFLKRRQPEKTIYFQKPLKLRPNWELTEQMDAQNTTFKEQKGKKGKMEKEFDF